MVIGIDPAPVKSAFVVWTGQDIFEYGIEDNEEILLDILPLQHSLYPEMSMAIEKVACYGMTVGASIFETVFWTGRFCQVWGGKWYRVPRMDVKMHLCHNSRAKDSNVRQALIDRFEPDLPPRCRPVGVLKGISKDCWQALALAVYHHDTQRESEVRR